MAAAGILNLILCSAVHHHRDAAVGAKPVIGVGPHILGVLDGVQNLAAVGIQSVGHLGRDGKDLLEIIRGPGIAHVHAHRMLVEREVVRIDIGQRVGGIGEEVVEHRRARSFALLHMHLAGLDEVAAVGAAARVDAKALLQVVLPP